MSEANYRRVKTCLDRLGIDVTADDAFETRLLVQKAVHLLQTSGLSLGYRFSWYKRGAYSPSLMSDYYGLRGVGELDPIPIAVGSPADVTLNRVRAVLEAVPQGMPPHFWAELLSSVKYFGGLSGFDEEVIRAKILAKKAHLSEHTSSAIDVLNTQELFN